MYALPWKPPPLPDPTREVKQVAKDYALEVRSDMKRRGGALARQQFEDWRERSMGHGKRPSVLKVAAAEQVPPFAATDRRTVALGVLRFATASRATARSRAAFLVLTTH